MRDILRPDPPLFPKPIGRNYMMDEKGAKEQPQRTSCSSGASSNEAISCKLPLLDGDYGSTSQSITAQVDLDQTQKLQHVYLDDKVTFDAIVCTAWALVLRCFIGQEKLGFYLDESAAIHDAPNSKNGGNRDRSIFLINFDQQEPLSAYIKRAELQHALLERRRQNSDLTKAIENSNSNDHQLNTAIRMQDSWSSQNDVAEQDLRMSAKDDVLQVRASYP